MSKEELRKEKIKSKIKALLSKTTENGATKEEMESALSKANQLMTDFFIEENKLNDDLKDKLISKSVEMVKAKYKFQIFYSSLALLFDCKVYYNRSSRKITFFGHEQDVDLCVYFYEVITKATLKAKEDYLRSNDYKLNKKLGYHGKTLTSSFVKGFLVSISNKMQEMYKEKESNIKKGTGLITFEKKKKVENAFRNLGLNIRTVKTTINGQSGSYNQGKSKGKDFNINQGVNSSESKVKMIGS